jgi:hypothetical protein
VARRGTASGGEPQEEAVMAQAPWDAVPADAGPPADALARRPGVGRVLACIGLGALLFVGTLGIGYLIWSVVTWGRGQTPAQRMLGLRCFDLATWQVAGREQMAGRQVLGWCFNGQLLVGLLFVFTGSGQTSVGDALMGTTVLRDNPAPRPAPPPSRA